MKFSSIRLSKEVMKAIDSLGFSEMTKVQEEVILKVLEYKDVVVKAKTGSGKTAAFAIPIVDNMTVEVKNPKALVLTPTRELAVQVCEEIGKIGRHKRIRSLVVYGKQSISMQINQLKQRVHVVVGTPGRVNDLIRRGELVLSDIDYFVLDEADELLRRGFLDDILETLSAMPSKITTLLFSATMPKEIQKICDEYMNNPKWVEIEEEAPVIHEVNYQVDDNWKFHRLQQVLDEINPYSCLIFCNTQKKVDELYSRMKMAKLKPLKLHGGMNQRDRLRAISSFKKGDAMCLVATDLAARGIHIDSLELVINYELPQIPENYIHRIGRTGRVNEEGIAVSFVSSTENKAKTDIEKLLGKSFIFNEIDNTLSVEIDNTQNMETDNTQNVEIDNNTNRETDKKKSIKRKNKSENTNKKSKILTKNDIMRIRINIGKKKKIRAIDVVGAISNVDGISSEDIGIIEICDTCTYIDIMNYKGNIVLNKLTKVKGKNARVVLIRKQKS